MLNDQQGVNDDPSAHTSGSASAAPAAIGTVQPADELVVSDLAVLRVLSDSLRIQLIEAFGRTRGIPRSVKEVAREIGQSPTKLYYHVNLLEEHGLLLVAESRLVSGIVEKRYVPAARQFKVDKSLLRTAGSSDDPEGRAILGQTIETVLESTAEDFKRAIAAGIAAVGDDEPLPRRTVLSRSSLRLRPADAQKIIEMLEALVATPDDDEAADATTYGLTLAFYPRMLPVEETGERD
jgi:transposase-like protein